MCLRGSGLKLRVHTKKKKKNFLISQTKHILWVLKETVSLRPFFLAPKTFVKIDGFKNIYNFAQKILFIETYEAPFTFRNSSSTGTEVAAFTCGQTGSSVSTCPTSPYVLVNSIFDIGNSQNFYSSYSIRA